MAKLIILSGIPAAGKSTYSCKLLKKDVENTAIISTDSIREEFGYKVQGNHFNDELEKLMWKTVIERAKIMSKLYKIIVIDSTAITNKRRMWYYNQLKNYYDNFELHILSRDVETCLKRNRKRERVVPDDAIQHMFDIFQEPNEEVLNKYTIVRVK